MIVILSPSKTINPKPVASWVKGSKPQFLEQAEELVATVNKLGSKLAKTFGVSPKIGQTNAQQFKDWRPKGKTPTAWAYRGETFFGLSAEKLNESSLEFAQQHLFIVSGLYGLLRPADLIMPYRLEMSTRLKDKWGRNLYEYWDNSLANHLVEQNPVFILNCASNEYSKAVIPHLPKNLDVITPKFLSPSQSGLKPKMAFAKYTRGLMARWAVENEIKSEDIIGFSEEGYAYQSNLSTLNEPVFVAPASFSLKGRWTKT